MRANEEYLAYRARGLMSNGRRLGPSTVPKPWVAPDTPAGKINVAANAPPTNSDTANPDRNYATATAQTRAACPAPLKARGQERTSRLSRLAQTGACRDHRCPAGMDGVNDLGGVDPLEVDGRDTEVGVSELALDEFNGTPSLAISTVCA
jgi:hypothetical protein